MLETAHKTVSGFRIARIRKVARPAAETTRSARPIGGGSGRALPPPLGWSLPTVFPGWQR